MTKDGIGCVGEADTNACFDKKVLSYADIDVIVKDVETLSILSNKEILLTSGLSSSKLVGKKTSDS